MRRPFTRAEVLQQGISLSAIRWQLGKGTWQRIGRGVYLEGGEPPTPIERALAVVIVTDGVASGTLAGILHGLDAVRLAKPFVTLGLDTDSSRPGTCRRGLAADSTIEINGYRCTNGLQTLVDMAAHLDDIAWEQALESALRKRLVTVVDIKSALKRLSRKRTPGVRRMRRVLRMRPPGAPPTESLLETLMVQLIRNEPALPEPSRQVEVHDRYERFVARVDLAWPDKGVFIELDGQHHKNQPLYDARRETAIVATTGWLPGRFTWTEVVRHPKATGRRLIDLLRASELRNQTGPLCRDSA